MRTAMILAGLGLSRLLSQWRLSAGSFLVLALICFLSGFFTLVVHNLELAVGTASSTASFQIFWRTNALPAEYEEGFAKLKHLPGIEKLTTFTPDQALEAMLENLGGQLDSARLVGKAVLPATAVAVMETPADQARLDAWGEEQKTRLREIPGVEEVTSGAMRLESVKAMRSLRSTIFMPLTLFFGLAAAATVGLAFRLSARRRQREVEVMRLVGATEFQIRFPMMVQAGVVGLAASVTALAGLSLVTGYLAETAKGPPLWLSIGFLPASWALVLVGGCVAACCASAWLAGNE